MEKTSWNLVIFCCLLNLVNTDINPGSTCINFRSNYHMINDCECVTYMNPGGVGPQRGRFTSPNHPEHYPPDVNCILYQFVGDIGQIIKLSFLEFSLREPTGTYARCVDYLNFFLNLPRPEVNEFSEKQYKLCGNISTIQKEYYSSTRSLILEFHSGPHYADYTGFAGIFEFLPRDDFITEGEKQKGQPCSWKFYSNKRSAGRFFSDMYPQNYRPNMICTYLFYAKPNQRVEVTFLLIDLQRIDGSCRNSPDVITVHDGASEHAPVIGEFCSQQNSEVSTSSASALFIMLKTDAFIERQGFSARYRFIASDGIAPSAVNPAENLPSLTTTQSLLTSSSAAVVTLSPSGEIQWPVDGQITVADCTKNPKVFESTEIPSKNGTISSCGYPYSYLPEYTETFEFTAIGRERIRLEVVDIQLAGVNDRTRQNSCPEARDRVLVETRSAGQWVPLAALCSGEPPALMSDSSRMRVRFDVKSTKKQMKPGFRARFAFVTNFNIDSGEQQDDEICSFRYRSSKRTNGTFMSPNYPGKYPRNIECNYRFIGQPNEQVYINFIYFDVEGVRPDCDMIRDRSDYVELSNFEAMDSKMERYCGPRGEPRDMIVSDASYFRVTFRSNGEFDGTGFEAKYQFRKKKEQFGKRSEGTALRAPNGSSRSQRESACIRTIALTVLSLAAYRTSWSYR